VADLPPCVDRLAEARLALHKLQTGQQAVETWTRAGLRTRYTVVDIDALRTYIRELEAECGGPDGGPLTCSARRRPFGVWR